MPRLSIELRAGEGGQDAEAFCAELRSAISNFARRRSDAWSLAPSNPGTRTLIIRVDGSLPAYLPLAGVHRIQRVPKNGGGRRHTSTATVAVLEAQDRAEVHLVDADVQTEVYKGLGPGGQHHQKNQTAVRLTHLPTGITVTVERGRSQWQNLQRARQILIRRLTEREQRAADATRSDERRSQVSSGERPVKQFTHNAQRSVVISHETGRAWRWADFYRGRLDADSEAA